MQLRKLRVLLIPVLATALALAGSSPATAGGNGNGLAAGVVNGTVTTNPGVPADPTNPTATNTNTFTFVSTTIVGSVTVTDGTNAATFAGPITVGATGLATDTAALGTGKVDGLGGGGTSATGSISVSLSPGIAGVDNTFVRVGAEVVVVLKLVATVTSPITGTVTGLLRVVVAATFVPTSDPTNPKVNQALFAGSFTGGPAIP